MVALIANGNTEPLTGRHDLAKQNGPTGAELAEVIIHPVFFAGWPWAMSAIRVARDACKIS